MKKSQIGIIGFAVTSLGVLSTLPVQGAEVEKTFKVSGQVNRVVTFTDDGDNTYVRHVDNNASVSRFILTGEAKSKDLTIGATLELGLNPNNSADTNQANSNASQNPGTIDHRAAEIYFEGRYGMLSIGNGDSASDGITETDLSGTDVASGIALYPVDGFTFLQDGEKGGTTAGTVTPGPAISDVFSSLSGLERADRVRYDTPSFQGFTLSASTQEGGNLDAKLSYEANVEGVDVAAAAGYANTASTSSNGGQYGASASAAFANGFNVTLALAGQENETANSDNPFLWYGKLGYRMEIFGMGETAFSVDYHSVNDLAQNNDEARSYGVQVVQNMDAYGTELYAAFRNFSLDRTGKNYQDITAGWLGARVTF